MILSWHRQTPNKLGEMSVTAEFYKDENLCKIYGQAKNKMRLFDNKGQTAPWNGCWNIGRKADFIGELLPSNAMIVINDMSSNNNIPLKKYVIKANTVKELMIEQCVYEFENRDGLTYLFVPSDLCPELKESVGQEKEVKVTPDDFILDGKDLRPMTYGEKAVGMTFNPSNLLCVQVTKQAFANVIDDLHQTREDATDLEIKRLCSIAITEAQGAQMWAVKALTWKIKK